MANLKQSNRSQGLFLTVNLEDQLIPGTFEWTMDNGQLTILLMNLDTNEMIPKAALVKSMTSRDKLKQFCLN
jgi:hypothetical protein